MSAVKKTKRVKSYITDEDSKPENVKWSITIRVSGDVLDAYRAEANRLGIGYQTLMQIKLKEGLSQSLEKRVEELEKKLKGA